MENKWNYLVTTGVKEIKYQQIRVHIDSSQKSIISLLIMKKFRYFWQMYQLRSLYFTVNIPIAFVFKLYYSKLPCSNYYLRNYYYCYKQVWPSILLAGCRLAWWRNNLSCGLQTEYKNPNSEVGKWLHLVFGLSLCSHEEVEDVFVEEIMTIQPINSNLTKFTNYSSQTIYHLIQHFLRNCGRSIQ
ncbi:Uncharacterized protein FWK35_00025822 [Aphis craccivora]|uniref:Uncharacterized protein n=1 Tax=Aphis craccivora TaxID=307492 RepID=A0A6G0Z1K4_APHCR|nr:Uncharacterized protein FWK35_00025822 [Aphis craccivora]